jgi:ADP-ribosylation factor related protein 1
LLTCLTRILHQISSVSQFSLLHGFWNYFFASVKINVLIIGVDNAGKTTLLERIKTQYGTVHGLHPSKIPPTIGMNLAKIKYKGTQVVFWDLGGQTKMRKVWESYYAEANAVVFVADSGDNGRLQDVKDAFTAACANDILAHTPVIFLANKQDLPHARVPAELMAEVVGAGPGALLIKGGIILVDI